MDCGRSKKRIQPGYGEQSRIATRQRIVRQLQAEDRGDEDDWVAHPLQEIMGWVADICVKLEWKITPREVLQTEREYPGLIGYIALEVWQKNLIEKQLATQAGSNGTG